MGRIFNFPPLSSVIHSFESRLFCLLSQPTYPNGRELAKHLTLVTN